MTRKKNAVVKHRYPFQYKGNIVLFVIFLIIFPPIGIVLAIKNLAFLKGEKSFAFSYRGSYGWLIFWAIFFFPIAILLLLIKGIDVIEESARL
jgi:hypothetical protein